ncbi:MAG: pilus assembly protein PilM [Planctomycetales bacterium]|nr:pilus assembly protein PilM [Planctomycetales bacterium]
MASGQGVWGIDIGQCAFKALRGTVQDDGTVLVDAFDYIEYPKILSQPDAKPDELIRAALKQFLSRNSLRGDRVAISLSGQSGLARFVKLPPVESKKIPQLVSFEAKQQIPFSLDDVVWDYQTMPGAAEEDGFALEAEVGIFAIKRDQVFRMIQPLIDAEVELDLIQLTPLAFYNAVTYDFITDAPPPEEYDPDEPPPSVVAISMGTETSDLVVTDGYRVWQRSIPLGGNHFTKQLTKELKLTFAKAEQTKRNALEAEDARSLFQAMRPVFNDLVTEVQRSIGFFKSLDRKATIQSVVVTGNAVKLPGLANYLEKNLELPVTKLDQFNRLEGPGVLGNPVFTDNVMTFPVCYGLILQGAGQAKLRTSLLPREILTQRLIRRKKPWVAAMAGSILLACAFNYFFNWNAWSKVRPEEWKSAMTEVDNLKREGDGFVSQDTAQQETLARIEGVGEAAVGSSDGRLLWLELLKMVTEALPVDESVPQGKIMTLEERGLLQRKELYVDYIESQYYSDLSTWFTDAAKQRYQEGQASAKAGASTIESSEPVTDPAADPAADDAAAAADPNAVAADAPDADATAADATAADVVDPAAATSDATDMALDGAEADNVADSTADDGMLEPAEVEVPDYPAPEGGGWVIEIHGYHFHNEAPPNWGAQYVRSTLLKQFDSGTVELPVGPPDENGNVRTERFTAAELGIKYPILADDDMQRRYKIRNPKYEAEVLKQGGTLTNDMMGAEGGMGMGGMLPGQETTGQPVLGPDGKPVEQIKPYIEVPIYKFTVQFCWQQKRVSERLKAREEARLEAELGADEVAAIPGTGGGL